MKTPLVHLPNRLTIPIGFSVICAICNYKWWCSLQEVYLDRPGQHARRCEMTHWHNNHHEPFQGNEPCANCQFISQQPTSDYAIAQIWAQSNVSIKERRIDEPPHFRFCMYTRELRDLGTMPLSAIPESMQPASLHRSQPDRGSSAQVIEGEHQSQPVRDSSARS